MEKKCEKIFIVLILAVMVFPMVSAASFDFSDLDDKVTGLIDTVLRVLSPFFEKIIGDYSTSDFFFSKVLLLFLLIIIIKFVLDKTPLTDENEKLSLIIAIIVSVLAIRFINENNFFQTIFIQYGVLGIAITTVLPLVIFFYFIHNSGVRTYGRKVFWSLYLIALAGIWVLKSSEIPAVADWVYAFTMVAVIIFILFDKQIHSYLGLSFFRTFEDRSSRKASRELKKELYDLKEHYRRGTISHREFVREWKALQKSIKTIEGNT